MKVKVTSTVDRLADDYAGVAVRCRPDMVRVTRTNARQGKDTAKALAKVSAGRHGKRYPNSIGMQPLGPTKYEYGPNAAMPQGGMSFEGGSRNQPPHRDLARSLERQAPRFRRDVAALPRQWYG